MSSVQIAAIRSMLSNVAVNPRGAKPEAVGDDAHRGQRHRGGRQHRRKHQPDCGIEHTGRDGTTDGVVTEREPEVAADVAHGRVGAATGDRDAVEAPRNRVTPADSMATSVSELIANPTSAAANAVRR